ncbi:MAG: hypothetical protein WC428_02265 [Candidatus Paceibacterota bacterium]|jgi:hypothetical protein
MPNESFITHDFKLPNHSNELCKAEEVIEKLKNKFKLMGENKTINDKNHDELYNEIIRILDYVGRLSMPVFAIEEDMEKIYTLQYSKYPELAKKLMNDHYEEIHHPYTLLKNRCFRMLEELDTLYQKTFKKNPPNWNI